GWSTCPTRTARPARPPARSAPRATHRRPRCGRRARPPARRRPGWSRPCLPILRGARLEPPGPPARAVGRLEDDLVAVDLDLDPGPGREHVQGVGRQVEGAGGADDGVPCAAGGPGAGPPAAGEEGCA